MAAQLLASLGVYAYFVLEISSVVLLVLFPLCWFLPPRFVWIHLALVICNRLIWCAVCWQTDLGMAQFALETAFWLPVVASDLISIALNPKPGRIFVVSLFFILVAVPITITFMLVPYWIKAVQSQLIERVKETTQGKRYCLMDTNKEVIQIRDLSVQNLLRSEFWNLTGPRWYYALLVINSNDKPEIKNWSFRFLNFVPVSAHFQKPGALRICKTTRDALHIQPRPNLEVRPAREAGVPN